MGADRLGMKLFTVGVAVLVVVVIGGAWHLLKKPRVAPNPGDYAISLCTRAGKPIGTQTGPLRFRLDPFTTFAAVPNQRTSSFTVGADGFRRSTGTDPARPLAFVTGGSLAFGFLLDDDNKTFASRLNARQTKHSFENAGVVGFVSSQELASMVHRLDGFRPSLYVSVSGWNDVFDALAYVEIWPTDRDSLGTHSTFVVLEDHLLRAYRRLAKPSEAAETPRPTMNRDEYCRTMRDIYVENIDRMAAFARARGARFVLVIQPEICAKPRKSEHEAKLAGNYERWIKYRFKGIPSELRAISDQAEALCKRRGIPFVDVNQAPEWTSCEETLLLDYCHANEFGHSIIADIIIRTIHDDGRR